MNSTSRIRVGEEIDCLEILWQDGERVLCRISRDKAGGDQYAFTPALYPGVHPTSDSIDRLKHEYELRDYLESAWAVRPLELIRHRGRMMLVVDFQGEERLDRLMEHPLELGQFLSFALALSVAIGRLHRRGLLHKDLKPTNILVDAATARIRLTGFGITSLVPREHQPPGAPEFIAGTLPYMAPEQTGRMNRSIDSRSDLYSLGVTLYQMLTGSLPFEATEPLEWVHCHVAKRPIPPSVRLNSIPEPVSEIVMRLLSKSLEERYQTAVGLENDLRQCLNAWESCGRIDGFALGARDVPDRLMIPEKLYGREAEIDVLLAAFARSAAGGAAELLVVSGYAGIGKSSIVNELHKVLVPFRALFASGKFDQYKRDIPYATLAQAIQSLIRPLLSKNEGELNRWRQAILAALEPNGLLMMDLVPELKHILGEQPPTPELPPQDAQNRFKLVLRRFIGVFARPEHPLVLFLDDLQWLDTATLDLLEDLLIRAELRHLLLIGAYRDSEVSPTHPLARKLILLRQLGANIREIVLTPLLREDLGALLVDSLHCESDLALSLAQLVHEKTSGNPFFAIQFISTLTDEALLIFDYDRGRWSWDLNQIHAKGYTDNVVELMVGKLSRLSIETQKALQQFALLGNTATFEMLRLVSQGPEEQMHDHLGEAVRTGLIFRLGDAYRFLHDRVQEAAYSSIPGELRPEAHLRIGNLLVGHTPLERVEETIFEIVNHLNRGSQLITPVAERERVAELNLIAGKRAKVSTAYTSALSYLGVGRALLPEAIWEGNYDLVFAIECLMAEAELLTADMAAAENRLTMLALRATKHHDLAVVTRLRLTLYTALDRSDLCVEVFLEYLRRNGAVWPLHPSRDEVLREYERIWTLIGSRRIEELVDLPLMIDPDVLDALDVFTEIVHPAFFFDENLSSLVVCRLVTLSLEHGNCDASCFGYVWFAMFAGPRFHNYKDGYRFGRLGFDLVEKRGLIRYQARTYLTFATLTPWAKHAASARNLIHRAFDAAHRAGDLTFSAYSWEQLITNCLMVGDPLAGVQSEAETGVAFAKKSRFGLVVEICSTQLGLIRTLRGLTSKFGFFDDGEFDELRTECLLAGNSALSLAEFFYWTRKLQGRFFAGEYGAAVDAEQQAQRLVWTASSQVTSAEFPFYGALAHAASFDSASPGQKEHHLKAVKAHHWQLEIWAEHCPENFDNRAALVAAEIARMEGRLLDAEQFYEKAIRSARDNNFVHNEALADELAARFYAARGFETIAYAYLRNARYGYSRWGADGKVRQLDELYPKLGEEYPKTSPSHTIGTPLERLDLATVLKISQSVSGEMLLEKLLSTLMRTAIEHAGAERGLLLLPKDDEWRVGAEASTGGDAISVHLPGALATVDFLPQAILLHVVRTHETVMLDNASAEGLFCSDPYLRQNHVRSILCLPLINQSKLIGVLYLENKLTSHVFTSARIAILQLLASQTSISLENSRLYADLKGREAKIRRLVDSNIIGICIGNIEGDFFEVNDAFLKITGYDRDTFMAGPITWKELTPPEWSERDDQARSQASATATTGSYEKEILRKDGTRVPVLIGGATFEVGGKEGVAFVLDLSEQKRAESSLAKARSELAYATRIVSLGALTASIAHEVNQPLGAVVTNANACLRLLDRAIPDLHEAKAAIRSIIRDGNRGADVISRIRGLMKKEQSERAPVDSNELVDETVRLVQFELQGTSLQFELAEHLPIVLADRVQVQQVLLNLILNAIDAMKSVSDRPQILRIETKFHDGNAVMVSVRDSGIGIETEKMEHLFETFYTTKPHGLGMGLSISHSIIESHGGRLWAKGNDGPGATFLFTLPADDGGVI